MEDAMDYIKIFLSKKQQEYSQLLQVRDEY